ncbi:MAG: AbrB/MazE/SpoVT family DNA-binding domain-containing protein [Devosia nanyangense]|uniref:AbrB/MazE/SpoVT family DNA-binding domain-containing protein n=1 Tax=Devosia nanyangense TaxID=1228055 RepID=A0A933NXY8_9HYPH|nr:AbrB/MazE/SpoVT family DNA-binding domain-containing protein [Devosia nanyangense]
MRVAKWGNSLAVRLPSAIVDAMELKEGDEIDIQVAGHREFDLERRLGREQAIARLRQLLKDTLPSDFKFSREEANER